VPATATIDDLPSEVTDNTITLKWSEPRDNGKIITQYTVYQRIVTDGKPGEWIQLRTITDVSVRELKVELKQGNGNVYEFVVTATNELGESLKDDGNIKRVKASGVPPTITKKSKGKVTVVEGNVLYLACEAEGNPTPLFTWRKNGKILQSSINKTDLIIDDASKEDAGNYECKVVNSVGAKSYTVEVTIKGIVNTVSTNE
ncbi:fibroblast growth factor receptor homolog 1-like, partial [Oculina patagonica]